MEMVAARCSVCGGDVQMDASMQSGTCLYCGAKMVFEEAIKNAGERARAHALLRLGWDALAVHNWKEAMRYAGQALEQGADCCEGYFLKGMALAEEQRERRFLPAACFYGRSSVSDLPISGI